MLTIHSNARQLFSLPAVNAAPGGRRTEHVSIPVLHFPARFDTPDLDALLILADLQCYDRIDVPEADRTLMSHVVCREIAALGAAGLLPAPDRTGVLLAGDLYAIPSVTERGGTGDVDALWHAFADAFRWVAGVAGNHDLFRGEARFPTDLLHRDNVHPLDGDVVNVDGLTVGGISGIPGKPRKPWRYDERMWAERADRVFADPLDILLLHQGPKGAARGCRGELVVNQTLESARHTPHVVAFGHCQWPIVLEDRDEMQWLNVDSRVVVLLREGVEVRVGSDVDVTPRS